MLVTTQAQHTALLLSRQDRLVIDIIFSCCSDMELHAQDIFNLLIHSVLI